MAAEDREKRAAAHQSLSVNQPAMTPWKVIQTYSSDEWEAFIVESTEGFDPPYTQVVHLAGAGDKGRDVVGYLGDPSNSDCEWDSYQCKHYHHALRPTDIYVELGKLCVYTHRGDFRLPRRYRFVAPCGVGTKLHDLLKKPEKLRAELIANWDKYCTKEISDTEGFPLEGALKAYVEAFDFRIVWFLTPQEVLNQHQRTKYWHRRFKIEPPGRPPVDPVPEQVQTIELAYTARLFEAYADHLKRAITSADDLSTSSRLLQHFKRSRGFFFSAEALGRFSRDHWPGAFDAVKQHVHDAVVDITQDGHADGYRCVLKVTEVAAVLPLPHSDLVPYVGPADKKGLCHHLANDGRLSWVPS
jgi:hypothetical protein